MSGSTPAEDTAQVCDAASAPVQDAEDLAGTVGREVRRGFGWSMAGQIVGKFGTFALNLILARLLFPEDFGLFAIALSVVSVLIMVNDVGTIAACMRWQGDFDEVAPTATVIALGVSVFCYVLALVSAPALAEWSGNAAAAPLIQIMTITVVFDGIIAIRTASLLRNFQQDKLAKSHLISIVAQMCVAIPAALAGFGATGMIAGFVAGHLALSVATLCFARLPFTVAFDPAVVRQLMAFGIPLAVALGVDAVIMGVDYFIVGNILGTAAVGLYLLAFNISSWVPGVVQGAVRWVAIPGFARVADDQDALVNGLQRSIAILLVLMLPIGIAMIVLAPALITVLYGAVWAPAVEAMRWLVVLGVLRVVLSLVGESLVGLGRPLSMLWVLLAWAAVLIPALIYGTKIGGIRGTGIAHVVVGATVALPLTLLLLHRLGVRLAPIGRQLLRPVAAGVLATATCVLLAWAVAGSPVLQLLIAGPATLIVYVLVAPPFDQVTRWMSRAAQMLRSRIAQRHQPSK